MATRSVSTKSPEVANKMDDVSLELASLLCSRLCHDLLSPVGALTNGLELLAEEKDPEMRKRCFELLEQSARISADKLKFFRLAFGAAGGFGEMVPVAEPRALIDALVGNNGRITVNWALGGDALPKPAVKTLLNLSLIARNSGSRFSAMSAVVIIVGTLIVGSQAAGAMSSSFWLIGCHWLAPAGLFTSSYS